MERTDAVVAGYPKPPAMDKSELGVEVPSVSTTAQRGRAKPTRTLYSDDAEALRPPLREA